MPVHSMEGRKERWPKPPAFLVQLQCGIFNYNYNSRLTFFLLSENYSSCYGTGTMQLTVSIINWILGCGYISVSVPFLILNFARPIALTVAWLFYFSFRALVARPLFEPEPERPPSRGPSRAAHKYNSACTGIVGAPCDLFFWCEKAQQKCYIKSPGRRSPLRW